MKWLLKWLGLYREEAADEHDIRVDFVNALIEKSMANTIKWYYADAPLSAHPDISIFSLKVSGELSIELVVKHYDSTPVDFGYTSYELYINGVCIDISYKLKQKLHKTVRENIKRQLDAAQKSIIGKHPIISAKQDAEPSPTLENND